MLDALLLPLLPLCGVVGYLTPPSPAISHDTLPPAMIQFVRPWQVAANEPATFHLASARTGSWAEYEVDWNGDGTFEPVYIGPNEPTALRHTFDQPGVHTVAIRLVLDGSPCATWQRTINVEGSNDAIAAH
jgi:hypothetical protein